MNYHATSMSDGPPSLVRPRATSRLPLILITLYAVGFHDATRRAISEYGLTFLDPIAGSSRLLLLAAALSTALLLTRRSIPTQPWFFALLVYMTASVIWSAAPFSTLSHVATMWLITGTIVLTAALYGREELFFSIRNIVTALTCLGLIGYVAGARWAMIPGTFEVNILGQLPAGGLFGFNVIAGVLGATSFYLLLCLPLLGQRVFTLLLLAASAAFTILTGSATGILMLVIALPLRLMLRFAALPAYLVFGLISLAAVVGITVLIGENVPTIFGRDAGLSGRTVLWQIAAQLWTERPVLGWGMQSLLGEGGALPQELLRPFGSAWVPPHFHNDWLQFLAELGVIGTGVFFTVLSTAFRRGAAGSYDHEGTKEAVIGIVVLSIVNSVVNGSFNYLGPGWFFLVLILFSRNSAPIRATALSVEPDEAGSSQGKSENYQPHIEDYTPVLRPSVS